MSNQRARKRARRGRRPLRAQEVINIHAVQGETAWVHSHGLRDVGLPELEIRGIPRFLSRPAAALLNDVADYMLSTDKRVELGDLVRVGPLGLIAFARAEPQPDVIVDHYDHERWTLVDPPVEMCECPFCEAEARRRGLN